ncbi:MAG: hypothetical protein IJP68_05300 [Selenomonadaceae bacterium]|nr:hypothetical protein [Selenomonadaceae bacterium]
MINPTHRLKKPIKYNGNDKPATFYITDAVGWLGSGVKDCNGQEIFEGDIMLWFDYDNKPRKLPVSFRDGRFWYKDIDGNDYPLNPKDAKCWGVVGHIATEGKA